MARGVQGQRNHLLGPLEQDRNFFPLLYASTSCWCARNTRGRRGLAVRFARDRVTGFTYASRQKQSNTRPLRSLPRNKLTDYFLSRYPARMYHRPLRSDSIRRFFHSKSKRLLVVARLNKTYNLRVASSSSRRFFLPAGYLFRVVSPRIRGDYGIRENTRDDSSPISNAFNATIADESFLFGIGRPRLARNSRRLEK